MDLHHCLARIVTHTKTKSLSYVELGIAIILFIMGLHISCELQSNLRFVQQV